MQDAMGGPVVLGAGYFGGLGSPSELLGLGLDEAQAHEVLDRCTALGITFVDTAHSYAAGAADRMIGSWLSTGRAWRPRIAVLHKVGVVVDEDSIRVDLSPDRTRAQIDDALERLDVDTIDVIAIHAPDQATPPIDTARVFVDALESGQARAWGLSNVDAANLDAWLEAADRVGLPNPRLVENEYSLLNRADEADVLPTCRELGVEYLAYSPLAGGVLTGKYQRGEPPPPGSMLDLRPESATALDDHVHAVVAAVRQIAADHACTPAAVALAWVRDRPGVRPIIGPRRPEHLDAVEEMLSLSLTDTDRALLDEVSAQAT
jgi:aryl-alcohol dehydrogenase-like predicted oxidoreductase